MPMLDAYIPEGALSPQAEEKLLARLTDLLLEHEGADPTNETVRSLARAFVHRVDVYAAEAPPGGGGRGAAPVAEGPARECGGGAAHGAPPRPAQGRRGVAQGRGRERRGGGSYRRDRDRVPRARALDSGEGPQVAGHGG